MIPVGDGPGVAVVVPTRDRPGALARCLDALARQTRPPAEVVVVDDGSRDAAGVRAAAEGREHVRLVRAEGVGPAGARNAGVAATESAFVLLTDDDCIPAPDWVERLSAPLERGAEAAAGATVNGLAGSALAEAAQLVAEAFRRPTAPGAAALEFAASSNLGCRRDLLLRLPFDERYRTAAGEDRDWCARLADAGVPLVPADDAVVVHEHELTLGGFLRQQFAYGRGAHRFRRTAHGSRSLEDASFYARLVARGFAARPATGIALLAAQAATAAGFLAEGASARRHRPARRPR